LSFVHNVCAGCDGFDATAVNKLNYDSSGYEYGGDFYLADGNYIVVDDMESYNDSNNYIWDTWRDGTNGGLWSFIELAIDPCGPIHGGNQSMDYAYDNREHGCRCPDYSEAVRWYNPALDWTTHGEKALVLWFHGSAGNGTTPMWVRLKSQNGYSATTFYGDNGEDPEDIKLEQWTEWNIRLSDFADGGVDLANVASISIGFGDWPHGEPDGTTGTVYFDDIRLYPARCLAKYSPPADFTGDCAVDWQDLEIIGREWLHTGGGYLPGAADSNLESVVPPEAWNPSPADGDINQAAVDCNMVLEWNEGNCLELGAGLGVNVLYFSTDCDLVESQPTIPDAGWNDQPAYIGSFIYRCDCRQSYDVGPLPLWTTYCWRVDQGCGDGTTVRGDVWTFTTGCVLDGDTNMDCLVNFLDYAALAEVWMDQTPPWPPE
jgi:hypothetical protein